MPHSFSDFEHHLETLVARCSPSKMVTKICLVKSQCLAGEITMFAGEIPMFLKDFSDISHPRRSFIQDLSSADRILESKRKADGNLDEFVEMIKKESWALRTGSVSFLRRIRRRNSQECSTYCHISNSSVNDSCMIAVFLGGY